MIQHPFISKFLTYTEQKKKLNNPFNVFLGILATVGLFSFLFTFNLFFFKSISLIKSGNETLVNHEIIIGLIVSFMSFFLVFKLRKKTEKKNQLKLESLTQNIIDNYLDNPLWQEKFHLIYDYLKIKENPNSLNPTALSHEETLSYISEHLNEYNELLDLTKDELKIKINLFLHEYAKKIKQKESELEKNKYYQKDTDLFKQKNNLTLNL